MSDISIPGLTSRYNTSEIVEGLVAVEKERLTALEKELDSIEEIQSHWREVNRRLTGLQGSVKKLYGFENPFSEKTVNSSDEAVLTAIADRSADLGDYNLKVLQTAKSDRLLSASLDEDFRVEAGDYSFKVGDEEVRFRFRGGGLRDFARKLNEQGNNIVRATVVRDTADTQVLMIEAIPTGSSNRLFFSGAAEDLALATSMIRKVPVDTQQVSLQNTNNLEITGLEDRLTLNNGEIELLSKGEVRIPLDKNFPIDDGTILEMEIKVDELNEDQLIPEEPVPPSLPDIPALHYKGIVIQNSGSQLELPPWENPPPPPRVDDLHILRLSDGTQNYSTGEITPSPSYQKIQIRLKDYLTQLNSIELSNANTHRNIYVRNIQVYNPDQQRGFEAANPVDTAQDALLEFNGIQIRRETNTIDDLIPGVDLNLRRASDREVELNIEPDTELAKEGLIEFVYQYNRTMTEILILSQDNTDIIDEIEYFSDDEREKAMEDLGSLRGDLTLMQIKNRLQAITTAPYETDWGNQMALLAQIGISTNETGGGGYNAAKLRGYLEVDEDELDKALNGNMDAVKQLFGMDSDGDLIMDSGVGVQMDNYLKAFTQSGGILAMKNDRLDMQIDDQKEDIDEFKTYLEDYEADLKEEYGNMEGMLNQLDNSSNALNGLMQQEK